VKIENEQILDRINRVTVHVGYMESLDLPKMLTRDVLGDHERAATYYLSERKFQGTNAGSVKSLPEKLFGILHRNATPPSTYFGLPSDRVITLGTRIDL
jgi:KUP system potassium uptake protein